MKILGIETSCDETAISVIEISGKDSVRVLSNVISSQVKIHAKYGGVYPALAAREHAKNIDKVLKLALKEAGLRALHEIDLIAVTKGPGLAVALIIGITFAKTLAWKYKKPIIGVNHLEGHIYSNWLPLATETKNQRGLPKIFPALNLIVSGGHTELVLMKGHGQYKLVGETMDDAAGEAFDKIARLLELGYPGGPLISDEAEKWNVDSGKSGIRPTLDPRLSLSGEVSGGRCFSPPIESPREFSSGCIPDLPRPMINSKDFNFSFSGLKTAVLYLVKDLIKKSPLEEIRTAVAHEAQQAIVDVLVSKTLRATKDYKVKSVLLSGGVSANSQLRITLRKAVEKLRISYFQPELKYTGDNAAMIALAGYFNYANKKKRTRLRRGFGGQRKTDWKSVKVDANLRI